MTRRSKSPISTLPIVTRLATNPETEVDQRQLMIKKLKQELIIARGKEKEALIMESYYTTVKQKIKHLEAEKAQIAVQNKGEAELLHRKIVEEKRELEKYKNELRTCYNEMAEVDDDEASWKISLQGKNGEVERLKKELYYQEGENAELESEGYRLVNENEAVREELNRFLVTKSDKEMRSKEIIGKVGQVKLFIDELSTRNKVLKGNLKKYENTNNYLNEDLGSKQDKIDHLEEDFNEKHDQIKVLIENVIELSHLHEKNLQETHHANNLLKKESEKNKDLNNMIKRTQATNVEKFRQLQDVKKEVVQIDDANDQCCDMNQKLKNDLLKCQQHLENLMKQNVNIQGQMEKYIEQDNHTINVIRKKQRLPTIDNMRALRTSRALKNSRTTDY